MATYVVTGYNSGLGGAVSSAFVQLLDPANGSAILARTNGGVREYVTNSGFYVWAGTVSVDLQAYEAVWDIAGLSQAGEIVIPPSVLSSGGGGGGGTSNLTVIGDGNGAILGQAFLIKRNDTLPYLRRQLVDSNGNAVAIGTADTVKFTMRTSTDLTMAGSAKVHASADIIDADQGIVEYKWAVGDTDTTTYDAQGRNTPYAAEFEVTRASDGKIETFPQADYIQVTIPRDLDPGVDP